MTSVDAGDLRPKTSPRSELIEQLILAFFKLGDLIRDVGAVLAHRLEMTLSIAGFVARCGRLSNHCTDRLFICVVAQVAELLIDHTEFGTQRFESRRHPTQSSFHEPGGHRLNCRTVVALGAATPVTCRHAPVAQLAEAAASKSAQCRFESDPGH